MLMSRLSGALQCTRPCSEACIKADRGLAGVAHRALDLLEIPHGEIVALLQVDTLGGSFPGRVKRHRIEFAREPCGKLSKLTLAEAELLQPLDQVGALPVGLLEQPAEGKREAMRTIFGCGIGKIRNCGQPLFGGDLPGRQVMNQFGNFGIGLPISLHIERLVPIGCRRQLWDERLLAWPVGVLGARRGGHAQRDHQRPKHSPGGQIRTLIGGATLHQALCRIVSIDSERQKDRGGGDENDGRDRL
jgi:hypothetical protein